MEYKSREGVTCRRLGISEFRWCDKSNRLYPSRSYHAFLPFSVRLKLVMLGDQIGQFTHNFRILGPAQSNHESSDTSLLPTSPKSGRQRGRPHKRAESRETGTPDKEADAADSVGQARNFESTISRKLDDRNAQTEGAGTSRFTGYRRGDD